ncbi:MAG: ATP-binding cassette domain-containing protein [Chloroflexota bacterium]
MTGAPGSSVPATVEVEDLVKVYPGGTRAVDGISFRVAHGEFLGFLGPNGAGKTTTIRILATLLRPTGGRARVAGLDVVANAAAVRRRIGFATQTVTIDQMATGRENLALIGRLHGMSGAELRPRVEELLELMGLTEAARKLAGTYSGGMRRRLDLASALVHRPEVLFLDEPTEGLDPQSRLALWDELIRINRAGTTMVLTTHYMEEADRLCERLAIIDHGKIVAEGSPAELKRSIGADSVTLRLVPPGPAGDVDADALAGAQSAVSQRLHGLAAITEVEHISDGIRLAVRGADEVAPEILRRIDVDGVRVYGMSMAGPTLDDVFLKHTGRRIRAEEADQVISMGW